MVRAGRLGGGAVHAVNNYKGSIYMVCDYMDHDLTGLMERCKYQFKVSQVGPWRTCLPLSLASRLLLSASLPCTSSPKG